MFGIGMGKIQLFLGVIILLAFSTEVKSKVLVYQDFNEFGRNEMINHGILYLGSRSEWLEFEALNSTMEKKELPLFHRFLFDIVDGVDDLTAYLENMPKFPREKEVVVRVPELHPQMLPILGRYWMNHQIRSVIKERGLLVFFSISTADVGLFNEANWKSEKIPALNEMKRMGIKVGLTMPYNNFVDVVEEILIYLKKRGVTIEHFILRISISQPNIFDYNSFVHYMNENVELAIEKSPGFNLTLIFQLEIDKEVMEEMYTVNEVERYVSLLARFLHRWGEEQSVSVMMSGFQGVLEDTTRFLQISSWESFLFQETSSAQTMVTKLAQEPEMKQSQFKSSIICSDFQNVLIDFNNTASVTSLYPRCAKPVFQLPFHEGTQLTTTMNYYSTDFTPVVTFAQFDLECNSERVAEMITVLDQKYDDLKEHGIALGLRECDRNSVSVRMTKAKNILVPRKNWEKYNWTPDNLPVNLNELHERLKNEYEEGWDVFVEGDSSNGTNNNCYGFKTYWHILKNWAEVHHYKVISTEELSAWFKNFDRFKVIPEELFQNSSDGRKLLSNFQDKCIVIANQVSDKPTLFNDNNLTGVTLNLIEEKYLNLDAKHMALLLQLIHFKFLNIEIVVDDSRRREVEFIGLLANAVALASANEKNDTENVNESYKYFLNLGRMSRQQISNYFQIDSAEDFNGAHLTFSTQPQSEILKRLQFLKSFVNQVGFLMEYEDAFNFAKNEFSIASMSNYVIINIDLWKILEKMLHRSPHDYFESGADISLFYDIFINLRGQRLILQEFNPNITVYARIAWPSPNNDTTFLRIWEFVNAFSTEFNFPFFVYEAFDQLASDEIEINNNDPQKMYGWWKWKKREDIGLPLNYIDKENEFYGIETPRPQYEEGEESEDDTSFPILELILGTIGFVLVLLLTSAVLIYRFCKLRREMVLTKKELLEFKEGTKFPNDYSNDDDGSNDNIICRRGYNKIKYEVRKDDFHVGSSTLIGAGNFGYVYKTYMSRFQKTVAVKMPKAHGKLEVQSVLREIKLMSYVGEHENILTLLGAYTKEIQRGVVFIVTEFLDNGSLLSYLRKLRSEGNLEGNDSNIYELFQFCEEISVGMDFLAQKRVVHGDLSARNVLLGEHNLCKISDFGLAKKLYDAGLYFRKPGEPIPWKWMAVETLQVSEFSLKSDIWSLGVTFWEIFSLGEEPYQGLIYDLEFCKKLNEGLRLPKPHLVNDSIYNEFLQCWSIVPQERPDASHLVNFFKTQKNSAYTCL